MNRPTADQTRYIDHLRRELRLPTNVFVEALYRRYGVQMVGRLTAAEACEVVYILRRLVYGVLPMPANPCELFGRREERAA